MDSITADKRSALMSRIKAASTKPEVLLRKKLFIKGLRYRINVKVLPGSPDLVFPRFNAVVFIHGCFWHQHGCSIYKTPKTNQDFWVKKFELNKKRDLLVSKKLARLGWRVAIIWECSLTEKTIEKTATTVYKWIISKRRKLELPKEIVSNSP